MKTKGGFSLNKPVFLAGNGIRLAGMADKFVEFAERVGYPVLTTWKGADLIWDSHPLYFGRPGCIASKYANLIIQNCTHLISIGARLDLPQIGYSMENFAPHAKKIIDKSDAKDTMNRYWDKTFHECGDWIEQCRVWKEQYPLLDSWVDEISLAMGSDDVLVPGSSGMACEMLLQRFKVKKGQRVIFSPGLGAMGFGLPQAIGVALASKRRVFCVIGDGCLQVNVHCLEVIKRESLPIVIFVLNNGGYASIRNTQRRHCEGRLLGCDDSSGMTLPDIQKIAWAYGVRITEIVIDPDTEIHPRMQSKRMPDGTIVPGRLEDVE